jgi:hypothetical protein
MLAVLLGSLPLLGSVTYGVEANNTLVELDAGDCPLRIVDRIDQMLLRTVLGVKHIFLVFSMDVILVHDLSYVGGRLVGMQYGFMGGICLRIARGFQFHLSLSEHEILPRSSEIESVDFGWVATCDWPRSALRKVGFVTPTLHV